MRDFLFFGVFIYLEKYRIYGRGFFKDTSEANWTKLYARRSLKLRLLKNKKLYFIVKCSFLYTLTLAFILLRSHRLRRAWKLPVVAIIPIKNKRP